MKRRIRKRVGIGVGVVLVLAGAWIAVGVLASRSGAMPSFGFLEGRGVYLRLEEKRPTRQLDRVVREAYTWETDSNDVCTAAKEELLANGFVEDPLEWPQWNGYRYRLKVSADEVITVRVFDRHRAYDHPLASGVSYESRRGWVSFEVMRERRSAWRYVVRGPLGLLYRWGVLR